MDAIRHILKNEPLWVLLTASAATLATAYVFQYGFGYQPCQLCYYQRWPYMVVIAATGLALIVRDKQPAGPLPHLLLGLAVVALLVDAGIAFFHVGVEQKWWEGPSACSSTDTGAISLDALLRGEAVDVPVRCDEPAWVLFGISMAGYNFLIALILSIYGLFHFRKGERA